VAELIMCGIAGFTGNKNIPYLEQMLDTISHRGQDDRSKFYANGISLGMNRLAINDLRKDLYPMKYKHYAMVFNGEIYNYPLVKKRLQRNGISLHSHCDGEVILPLFDLYGIAGLSRLEGMFAIAIIDTRNKKVILARDKGGEKPLYYSLVDNNLFFASELKTLLLHDQRMVSRDALALYLHTGSVRGERTLVESIRKVVPGTCVIYDTENHILSKCEFWNPEDEVGSFTGNMTAETLDELLRKSVESRLMADVPVGGFLSGGVDSSLVMYYAAQKMGTLRTYSTIFPEFDRYNEAKYSRYVAHFLGTNHTEITCDQSTVASLIDKIGGLIDDPIVDPAFLPTFLMAHEASKNVKVVLTGEGADELFGGYYRYQKELYKESIHRIICNIPGGWSLGKWVGSQRINQLLESLSDRYSSLNVWSYTDLANLLMTPFFREESATSIDDPLLFMQLSDMRGYLASQLFMKVDKATMQHTLEARAPYLDSRVMQFALSLPLSQKIRWFHGKYMLKQVAERHLPKQIVWRTKKGFSLPLGEWFRSELSHSVYESIDILSEYPHLINVSFYRQIVREHMDGSFNHRDKIWSMLLLAKWFQWYHIKE